MGENLLAKPIQEEFKKERLKKMQIEDENADLLNSMKETNIKNEILTQNFSIVFL